MVGTSPHVSMSTGAPTFGTHEQMDPTHLVPMAKLEPNIPGTYPIFVGTNYTGDQMSMGTKCSWGPNVQGTICAWVSNVLGTIYPELANFLGPFVLGDLLWGPNFRGRNELGTKCVTANFQEFIRITLNTNRGSRI